MISDRDDQFKYIAALRAYCREMGIPLISVDTKKKELIGLFANAGAVWSNAPKLVNDHDFPSLAKAKAISYGVYDLTFNHGLICLGDSSDTAEFAIENIVRWVQNFGRVRSPGADRLVILADCGGSNGNRSRAWKYFLARNIHQGVGDLRFRSYSGIDWISVVGGKMNDAFPVIFGHH